METKTIEIEVYRDKNGNPVCGDCKLMSDKKQSKEGCLSFPDFYTKKQRHYRVTVEFENEQREKKQVKLSGLAAFCVQHEIDHLEGVTIK